jgi:hypothetical protein
MDWTAAFPEHLVRIGHRLRESSPHARLGGSLALQKRLQKNFALRCQKILVMRVRVPEKF